MNDKIFLDTDVLMYCYTSNEPEKQAIARKIASSTSVFTGVQSLVELVNTLKKKYKLGWADIKISLDEISKNFNVAATTEQTVWSARRIAEQYSYSFFDSLIIAAAIEQDCIRLYSETLENNQVIDGKLKIINPFEQKEEVTLEEEK